MAKLVVIIGATGGQGSSVLKSLLANPNYKIRGVTRNTSSPQAQALVAKGVEMVSADANDVESLVGAFQGAHVIYAYTNFFEPFMTLEPNEAKDIEYAQGVNMAKAASKTSTLEHFIWSTLPDSSVVSNGTIEVPHFQSKAAVDEYIKKDAVLLAKTTFLWTTFYIHTYKYPILLPSYVKSVGKYVQFFAADPKTPVVSIGNYLHNIGIFVAAILAKPEMTLGGKYVFTNVETLTFEEILKKWSKVTGKPSEIVQISVETYNTLWPKWGLEFGINLVLLERFPDTFWGPHAVVGKEELEIDESLLIGTEQCFREMDWSELL